MKAPYKKFVLLCHPRSGSNLVLHALKQHPNTVMYSEIFHPIESERAKFSRTGVNGDQYYRSGQSARSFLENEVFFDESDLVRAKGFKLFYADCPYDRSRKLLWRYLVNQREIKIIHLSRENLLETYVSFQIALRTNDWMCFRTEARESRECPPFSIDPLMLQDFFDIASTWRDWMFRQFEKHPNIKIEYGADLCSEQTFLSTIKKIFCFLSLPETESGVRVLTVKQSSKPMYQRITNYDELSKFFRGSRYEWYFED